jgi:ABC-2 type transport system ATP-binding protein
VGLKPEAGKKIGQLSKGYKQRVGLAAALIHEPEVLIFDEPTSGLDPNQIVEIREVIKNLGKTRTVLFSSHILQEVQAICDRVIIINKGAIVANDSLANLQKRESAMQHIEVNFKEDVKTEWLNQFPGITGVTRISQLQGSLFNITCTDTDGVKKQLLQYAIDKNLNIISLQSSAMGNLEDIFRDLTKSGSN